jgi:hypothetical protein
MLTAQVAPHANALSLWASPHPLRHVSASRPVRILNDRAPSPSS